jgi:hypothetical protein
MGIGEMLMPRQTKSLHDLRSRPTQFDLFAHPADNGQTQVPEWRALPPETRQTLTGLIARLMLEHAHGDPRPEPAKERGDD